MANRYENMRRENMLFYGFGIEAMKSKKVCAECGMVADSSLRFCRECGHRLPSKTLYDIYKERHKCCPACDTVLADEMEYCPQCGAKSTVTKVSNE